MIYLYVHMPGILPGNLPKIKPQDLSCLVLLVYSLPWDVRPGLNPAYL
jgi:hypothetical protein